MVGVLNNEGHEVYDFRHPEPGNEGFHWSDIDAGWRDWTFAQFRLALCHRLAAQGFRLDMAALEAATAGVLVLPCGRSAHLEAGHMIGAGKPVAIYCRRSRCERHEPELMYRMAELVIGYKELLQWAAARHERA